MERFVRISASQSLRKSGLCRLDTDQRECLGLQSRNPFVNQVFVVVSARLPTMSLNTAQGRNPFVNQVFVVISDTIAAN